MTLAPPSILAGAAIALSLACFASFSWAIPTHFHKHGAMPAGMRVIAGLGLVGYAWMAWLLVMFPASAPRLILALVMMAFSLALFWAAISATRTARLTLAYSADLPQRLVRAGPYRFVRHPFYSAYILFWLAGWVASGQEAYAIVPTVMFLLYLRAARMEEGKFASTELAPEYAAYRVSAGMFLPRFGRRAIAHSEEKA